MKTVSIHATHTDEDLNYIDEIPYLIYKDFAEVFVNKCVYNNTVVLWDYTLGCLMVSNMLDSNETSNLLHFYNKDNLPSAANLFGRPKIDLKSSIESLKEHLKSKVSKYDDTIDRLLEEIKVEFSQRRDAVVELENADNIDIEISVSDPLVEDYSVRDGRLIVKTKYLKSHVHYMYDGDAYDFANHYDEVLECYWGEFIIVIPIFSNVPDMIEFYNLTRYEEGYGDREVPHPHVISGNRNGGAYIACWGDFAGDVAEAMSDKSWDFLIGLIMRFLLQPDTEDSAGIYTARFTDFVISNKYRSEEDVD